MSRSRRLKACVAIAPRKSGRAYPHIPGIEPDTRPPRGGREGAGAQQAYADQQEDERQPDEPARRRREGDAIKGTAADQKRAVERGQSEDRDVEREQSQQREQRRGVQPSGNGGGGKHHPPPPPPGHPPPRPVP